MGVTIHVTVSGMPKARKIVRDTERMVRRNAGDYAIAGLRGAATMFTRNFRSEGGQVGGWAPLKASTRAERESLGLDGAHPILFRYGDLRTFTATSLEVVRGAKTFAATDYEGGSIKVDVTPKKGSVNVVASGDKARLQVPGKKREARPYWFVNENVLRAARKQVIYQLADDIRKM